ncbi:MAG: solute-binding protein, partial [Blautia sp.]|nr:solute-binding protein [Blautia sp.]
AVSEGSNEIGIVYATDAASVSDKVDVIAEATADALKTPVLYPVGLIEDKEASEDDTAAAEAFLEYIKSDDAMKVFEKYGFTAYKADDASETDDKDAEATEEADDTETNAETETTEEAK